MGLGRTRGVEAVAEAREASGALLLVAAAAEAGVLAAALFPWRGEDGREEVGWWCIYGAWWS